MFASNSTSSSIRTQVDAVIYFFKKMDDEMINDLLFATITYQEFSKSLFVRKLGDLFYTFKQHGDTVLFGVNEIHGVYNDTDVIALTFIGNKSNLFIDFLFEIDDKGFIKDIYEFEDDESDRDINLSSGRLFLDNFEFDEDYTDYDSFY